MHFYETLLEVFDIGVLYLVLFIELIGIGVLMFIPIPDIYVISAVAALAMPLGLSNVVIPAAYGMDTTKAAAMALVSHLVSVVTIPLMFMLLRIALQV